MKSRDSFRKLGMDLAKEGAFIDWDAIHAYIKRARALRSASRKRGKR